MRCGAHLVGLCRSGMRRLGFSLRALGVAQTTDFVLLTERVRCRAMGFRRYIMQCGGLRVCFLGHTVSNSGVAISIA